VDHCITPNAITVFFVIFYSGDSDELSNSVAKTALQWRYTYICGLCGLLMATYANDEDIAQCNPKLNNAWQNT